MNKPLVLAYVVARALPTVTAEDARRLTHINIAFGLVGADGRLNPCQLANMDAELARIRSCHPAIRLVLSVGGWGAGGFSRMAMTEAGRRAFAESCAAYARAHDLDGIDIDWEYPCSASAGIDADPRDRENFTLLLQALRDALGENKIVSIAAGAGQYFVRDTEMEKVAAICDYVQIMTYDMRSGFCRQAGHHTALYAGDGDTTGLNTAAMVDMFHAAGVPLDKIIIGAAFYARHWNDVPNVNLGLLQPAGTIGQGGPDYTQIVSDFLGQAGWTRYFDEKAKAPFLFNGQSLISYDDPESLRHKCAYLREKGLLGIMYWEHSCDATRTLLGAISAALEI